ncbi:MAG: hypothetical protein ABI353_21065 [Isosphaeraceae bacterium]
MSLAEGLWYVGQAIDVRVVAVAAGERPEVRLPSIEGAEVLVAGEGFRPISSGAIGGLMTETNQYVYQFWVIPGRVGVLRIPPFRLQLGTRSGATELRAIDVRALPRLGRTSAFLGGVGGLSVSAEAMPSTLRVGQEFEYRIRLSGPAALGSNRRPLLSGLGRSALAPRIEPLDDEVVPSLPERVLRWRVRPLNGGEVKLPAVPIARFDPGSQRYLTLLAPSVPIRVVDVPTLDPGRLEYAAPLPPERPKIGLPLAGVLGLIGVIGALALAYRRSRRPDPRRLARRLAATLAKPESLEDLAGTITNALAEYLHLAAGRPPGVLTPDEAGQWVEAVSARPDLGKHAAKIIAECDRGRFAGRGPIEGPSEGLALFQELAKVKVKRGGAGRGP